MLISAGDQADSINLTREVPLTNSTAYLLVKVLSIILQTICYALTDWDFLFSLKNQQ